MCTSYHDQFECYVSRSISLNRDDLSSEQTRNSSYYQLVRNVTSQASLLNLVTEKRRQLPKIAIMVASTKHQNRTHGTSNKDCEIFETKLRYEEMIMLWLYTRDITTIFTILPWVESTQRSSCIDVGNTQLVTFSVAYLLRLVSPKATATARESVALWLDSGHLNLWLWNIRNVAK